MTASAPWRRAVLIVNAASRQGARRAAQAQELLAAAGVALQATRIERRPGRVRAAVEQAVADGADLVIVGGGDGTISSTIGALVGHDCCFALLPLGTANSFARTLGIGADLEEAVEAIAAGHTRAIDLGRIGQLHFANSAVIGLSPLIGQTIPHRLKRLLGRPGYLVWAAWTMARFSPFRLECDCDGSRRSCWATEVRMLNGRYAGGVELSEAPRLDSGDITVQIVSGKSRWRLALDWYQRIIGLPGTPEGVIELTGQRIALATRPVQRVALDGEPLARTPIVLTVERRAVQIVVPQPAV